MFTIKSKVYIYNRFVTDNVYYPVISARVISIRFNFNF